MSKSYSRYVCQQCSRVSASYMGKCPQCGSYNTMVEEIVQDTPGNCPICGMTLVETINTVSSTTH